MKLANRAVRGSIAAFLALACTNDPYPAGDVAMKVLYRPFVEAPKTLDPAVASIPASDVSMVVGQRAALDISAGGLLTPDAIAPETVPAKGETVVGLSLVDGMLPAIPLKTGDDVRVVQTPGAQGQVGDVSPVTIAAKVVAVTRSQDGQFALVDLLVSADAAPDLAARAATGKVAVVLDSRER